MKSNMSDVISPPECLPLFSDLYFSSYFSTDVLSQVPCDLLVTTCRFQNGMCFKSRSEKMDFFFFFFLLELTDRHGHMLLKDSGDTDVA